MEYIPRYRQPFTLSEAVCLDVSVITEEIARLQNSLKHLRETQETLWDCINSDSPEDLELIQAMEENKVVIGSQEERISILKTALEEKGVLAGSHYDLPSNGAGIARSTSSEPLPSRITEPSFEDDDDGVHL